MSTLNTRKKNMTEESFLKIKGLMEYGLKTKQVAEICGVSSWTVLRVGRADDFTSYKRDVNAYYMKQKHKQQERSSTEQLEEIPPSIPDSIITVEMQTQLNRIETKLDTLVERIKKETKHGWWILK